MDGTGTQRREERHGKRHEMGATIGGTIKDTIGCLIIDAIFPPHRHAETARGDDSETGDEQGQTARGTGRRIRDSDTTIRFPWKCFRLKNMYISCIPPIPTCGSVAIVIYSKR